jgi:hypothetical protein
MTQRKFKGEQKIEAQQILRECILARFTREESIAYMKTKLKRDDIEMQDYHKLKNSLKKDTETWMNSLMKDRWAYVSQYKERVDEYYKYQKEYWRIFHMNPSNGYLQKITLDSLQNVSAALTNLYDIMPEIAGATFVKEPISKTTEEKKPEIRATIPPVE